MHSMKLKFPAPVFPGIWVQLFTTHYLHSKLHSMAGSSAGCLHCKNMSLTFDPKTQQMHQWQKFGKNSVTDTGDIAETYSLGCTDGSTDGGVQNI